MSLTLILNVLLGLIFTWFLLSLAAMNIQEWLAARSSVAVPNVGKDNWENADRGRPRRSIL